MTTISAINALTFSKFYYVTNTSLIIIVLFCLLFCHETEDFVYYLIIAQMGVVALVSVFSRFFLSCQFAQMSFTESIFYYFICLTNIIEYIYFPLRKSMTI